ncbi:unnamed protein product [Prunus armeniaca]|uniref:Uncharacterized protein n=1 Tax=Prunus armeniaca TaxID=36596 RepID=A0A6J5TJ28_PRUAR|nr:unnamed protein product [Prunus armeniaca]
MAMRPDGLGFDCTAAQNEIGYSLEFAASLYFLKLISSHCGDWCITGVSFHAVFHIRAV